MSKIPNYITLVTSITSSGTQYIETDIKLITTDTIRSKWTLSSNGALFGCTSLNSGNYALCYRENNQNKTFIEYINSSTINSSTIDRLSQINDIVLKDGNVYLNGVKVLNTMIRQFTCSNPMYIFYLQNVIQNKISATCYGLQIIRNNQLIYNFAPAKNNLTNSFGFWEVVNGVWYGNAGIGDFIGGEEIQRVETSRTSSFRRRLLMRCDDYITPNEWFGGWFSVTYNITDTENAVKILNNTTGIYETMIVDGVKVPRATTYLFSEAGEHNVKFGYTGVELNNTFYNVGNILDMYFPENVLIENNRGHAPLYSTWIYRKLYIPGPISNSPIAGYGYGTGALDVNAEIEIYGLQNWTISDYNPNIIKKYTVKGEFSTIPANCFRGFNARNCYRYIWIESPNLTSIGNGFLSNMNYLETAVVNVTSPPTLSSTNAFQDSNNTFKLYVPYSSDHSILNAYKAANVWSNKASQIYELTSDGQIPTT